MSVFDPRQLDLFAPKPRNFDEAALVRRLNEAVRTPVGKVGNFSRAAIRRLMTPLPRITAFDEPVRA